MKKEEMLAKGNILKTLLKLSLPLVLSQLINVLYNVVDRIYIGNMPNNGTDALAGIGVTFPIIMIVSAFAALYGAGGAPLATIKLGEGNKKEAQQVMANATVMLLITGAILTVILLIFGRELLVAFGAKPEVIEYALDYMNIYAIGTIAVVMTIGLSSYATAQGFTKMSMISVAVGAILNIILDPIFIYVLDWGVSGAALATILSQSVSMIIIILFLSGKRPILRLSFKEYRFDVKVVLAILALGVAPFLMQATESFVILSYNIQIKAYSGNDYVIYMNLMTILSSLVMLIMMPLLGLAQGSTPLISYNYGAGNMERVKTTFKTLFFIALSYTAFYYVVIALFPNVFVSLFNDDPALLALSPHIIRTFMLGLSIIGIQTACQNTFMALRQPLFSLFLAVLRKIILLIPLIYILPKFLGIEGLYYAEPISDILAVSVTGSVFLFSFQRILDHKSEDLSMLANRNM